jgi:pimeloyl-ACP methyl ester carboxylesterase
MPRKSALKRSPRVDRATLFYRVRGSGPLLLILPGGHGDADSADALGSQLIDRFTVLTYDRRGMSRSKINAPDESLTIATHSDDAHRLLATLTKGARVRFRQQYQCIDRPGSRGALSRTSRHPRRARTTCLRTLARGRTKSRNRFAEAEEAFRREGIEAGFKKFVELAAVDYNDREPDAALPAPTAQSNANLSFFFRHDSPAVRRYHLDLPALKSARARIVPAIGQSSTESAPSKSTAALATQLGTKVVIFPGGHTAWLLRPKSFAAKLAEIFRA